MIRFSIRLLTSICVGCSIGVSAFAQDKLETSSDTFSLDTGYIPAISSTRAMRNFAFEFQRFGDHGFDWLNGTFLGSGAFGRSLLLLGGTSIAWGLIYSPVWIANHEMGHGAHAQAMGGSMRAQYAWANGRLNDNIFSFIADGYNHLGETAYTASSGIASNSPPNWGTAVHAAGMNNSMMLAETFEDEVFAGRGNVNQVLHYYVSKLDGYSYAHTNEFGGGGDANNVVNDLNGRGINASKKDMANGSMFSFLASSTSYAYIWGIVNYVGTGDTTVSSFKVGDFKLPDISFFQNRNGFSYRMRSALTKEDANIVFSAEYLWKGIHETELSAGYRWLRSKDHGGGLAQVFACTTGGLGVRGEKMFLLGPNSLGTLGASAFSVNSLEGEREITILTSNKMGGEVYARWSFLY
jgi:hypothetical protein